MLVDEAREARLAGGLTQNEVSRAIGLSQPRYSMIERGLYPDTPFVVVAQMLAAVGLQLAARAYPVEGGLRDEGQSRLIGRLHVRIPPGIAWRTEVPIGGAGDLRAWDVLIGVAGCRIGVDAETRLRDFQAVDRRIALKKRDSGVARAILLVADTRHNRDALRSLGEAARANYPVSPRTALTALAVGRDPGGDAILVL